MNMFQREKSTDQNKDYSSDEDLPKEAETEVSLRDISSSYLIKIAENPIFERYVCNGHFMLAGKRVQTILFSR